MQGGTAEKILVAIHAPDSLTHSGLASCLDGDQQLTETAKDDADVVVGAFDAANVSTMDTLRCLRPGTATPVLLIVDKRQWNLKISAAIEHGVRAVIWRNNFSSSNFIQAIRIIGGGGGFLPFSLQGAFIEQVQRTPPKKLAYQDVPPTGFTNREIDVLRLVSEGHDLEQISQKLHYSERTVKNTLYKFMKRHGLHNRAHAVAFAIRNGLI
ncbi:DNA-binding NarL/FixJ family response regulator [Saccharopolyspora phatthalungensis]|uniref:DNA-binding NarL/FixJ family response regulator n=1 Tax=Saccharopolyspora phatthalungensis TaxID=664693 RepID=A0A840QKL3_9PSEU|nr:DNA-binding NarL/FixJ family response regulator [Saccharopolyspora phatthalungensis]